MRARISIITSVVALGVASGLGAQQPKKADAQSKTRQPERDGCVTSDGKTECRYFRYNEMDSALMKRAAIGVTLSPTATARDTLGVFVSRVTPKGPAENAGIVEGDRIVSINGVDLRVNAADAGDGYAAGLPSRRLTREVGKLTPGSVINLRVYSGGGVRDVRVTAGRAFELREGGFYGLMDGMPPAGVFRSMPNFENMRIPLEQMRVPLERLRSIELPKMRMQMKDMDMSRMKFDEMQFPKLHMEAIPRLGEGARIRVYTPSMRDGEYRTYIVSPDGELKLEASGKAKEEREKLEKAEKQKSKK